MDTSIISFAFGLIAELSLPVILSIAGGAIVIGFFQSATLITDASVSFCVKVGVALLVLSFFGSSILSRLQEFSQSAWGPVS